MKAAPAVFIGLGSNVGDREATLRRALDGLGRRGFRIAALSSFYLTEPVGGPVQDWYLNAVAGGESELGPEGLLAACLEVERELGRVRRERWGPRTVDLDLLLYGPEVRRTENFTLPHARLAERLFVLVPLEEIAPAVRHPTLDLTVTELRRRCRDTSRVVRLQKAGERA